MIREYIEPYLRRNVRVEIDDLIFEFIQTNDGFFKEVDGELIPARLSIVVSEKLPDEYFEWLETIHDRT